MSYIRDLTLHVHFIFESTCHWWINCIPNSPSERPHLTAMKHNLSSTALGYLNSFCTEVRITHPRSMRSRPMGTDYLAPFINCKVSSSNGKLTMLDKQVHVLSTFFSQGVAVRHPIGRTAWYGHQNHAFNLSSTHLGKAVGGARACRWIH